MCFIVRLVDQQWWEAQTVRCKKEYIVDKMCRIIIHFITTVQYMYQTSVNSNIKRQYVVYTLLHYCINTYSTFHNYQTKIVEDVVPPAAQSYQAIPTLYRTNADRTI